MHEMIDKDKLARDIAIILGIIVAVGGMFAAFMLTPAQKPSREFALAVIDTLAKDITLSDMDSVLFAVKSGWIKLLIAIVAVYGLYYAIQNRETTKEMLATIFGLKHAAHKTKEGLKYAAKKSKIKTLEREKAEHLHLIHKSLKKTEAVDQYHMSKEEMKGIIEKSLKQLLKKKKEYTIKDVMLEIEKKRPMGSSERKYWIDAIREVIQSNVDYAQRKKQ